MALLPLDSGPADGLVARGNISRNASHFRPIWRKSGRAPATPLLRAPVIARPKVPPGCAQAGGAGPVGEIEIGPGDMSAEQVGAGLLREVISLPGGGQIGRLT